MNTATRPLPEHGQDDRCYRHGCRRDECRDAYRNTRKRADLRRAHGIPGHIEGPRVAAHLRILLDSGKTRLRIAAESGVADRTIRYILQGQREVQLANARALLAVQPLPRKPRIDSTGTRRRIQALATLGWPITHTADQSGISRRYAFDILSGLIPLVDRSVAERVATLYRQKATHAGPSAAARNNAVRKGWHGPLAWGADIDDPNAQPDAGDSDTTLPRIAQVAEDARWLIDAGLTRDQAADRLGVSRFYIDRALREHPADDEQQAAA